MKLQRGDVDQMWLYKQYKRPIPGQKFSQQITSNNPSGWDYSPLVSWNVRLVGESLLGKFATMVVAALHRPQEPSPISL